MELDVFITDTLSAIAKGIHEANDRATTGRPFRMRAITALGKSIEFDVAVTARNEGTTGGGGKIGIAMLQVNAAGEERTASENVSRIKFSVSIEQELG